MGDVGGNRVLGVACLREVVRSPSAKTQRRAQAPQIIDTGIAYYKELASNAVSMALTKLWS
jgi:hypothetical protein